MKNQKKAQVAILGLYTGKKHIELYEKKAFRIIRIMLILRFLKNRYHLIAH